MAFAIILARRPAAYRSGGDKYFREAIQKEAQLRFVESRMYSGNLYIRVIWFRRKAEGPDVDNILKPILDALKGVVYADDSLIVQCLSTRVDTPEMTYTISNEHIPYELYEELTTRVAEDEHVTYIEVGEASLEKIVFGPIDGRHTV